MSRIENKTSARIQSKFEHNVYPSLYFKVNADKKVRKMPMPLFVRNVGRCRLYMYLNESRDHLHHIEVYGTSNSIFTR
ncbi:hypothetical protein Dsin_026658 [Dipteronia sinensis]|uniref:Uncharacterized protein n=1 Tax=Dipteronia sinensis TaxID=43782 RepID=A0AAE0DY86_9ROSI|nr:hypothetical protein Dsin_026658 [Dipteronia sinensis]